MNPEAGDIADGGRLECHVVTRRNALHQAVELFSCVDPPAHAFLCARRGSNLSNRRRICRVERMYHDDVSQAVRGTLSPSIRSSMNPDCVCRRQFGVHRKMHYLKNFPTAMLTKVRQWCKSGQSLGGR